MLEKYENKNARKMTKTWLPCFRVFRLFLIICKSLQVWPKRQFCISSKELIFEGVQSPTVIHMKGIQTSEAKSYCPERSMNSCELYNLNNKNLM